MSPLETTQHAEALAKLIDEAVGQYINEHKLYSVAPCIIALQALHTRFLEMAAKQFEMEMAGKNVKQKMAAMPSFIKGEA
jgi:hypothetical protein